MRRQFSVINFNVHKFIRILLYTVNTPSNLLRNIFIHILLGVHCTHYTPSNLLCNIFIHILLGVHCTHYTPNNLLRNIFIHILLGVHCTHYTPNNLLRNISTLHTTLCAVCYGMYVVVHTVQCAVYSTHSHYITSNVFMKRASLSYVNFKFTF